MKLKWFKISALIAAAGVLGMATPVLAQEAASDDVNVADKFRRLLKALAEKESKE